MGCDRLAGFPAPRRSTCYRLVVRFGPSGQVGGTGPLPALCTGPPSAKGMRETWFGPLIHDVEPRIIKQMGDTWDRELFEEHRMGYTMRTDRYRLVLWRDHRQPKAYPIDVELFDHRCDPAETNNIAADNPQLVDELTKQLDAGWKLAL